MAWWVQRKQRRQPTAMQLVALIALQVCLGPVCAQNANPPQWAEETEKQENVYRSRGTDVPGGYVTGRTLAKYVELLPSGFSSALGNLGPTARWLDIGAGEGRAILDYHAPDFDSKQSPKRTRRGGKAQAVALSVEDRRTDLWRRRAAKLGADRIRYLSGKRLRDYTLAELGKFQLITDVYGGFSYTNDLSTFVEKVLDFLDLDGGFYTMVQSVHLQDGKDDPGTWYLTELVDPAGRDVTVCSWLKSVRCTRVACESQSTWEAPTELIYVRKVCNDVSVPRLEPLAFEAGTPPGRRFRLQR